uniref:XIAP-associated factor 1 n=1 Tax=Rhizophora mucronata TaxID=61149 RepID=A0A2P2KYD4_RHIMU
MAPHMYLVFDSAISWLNLSYGLISTCCFVSSDRAIPSSNIHLHFVHCSRNLEKCKICGDMIPKRHAEEHFLNAHAPVCFYFILFIINSEVVSLPFPFFASEASFN